MNLREICNLYRVSPNSFLEASAFDVSDRAVLYMDHRAINNEASDPCVLYAYRSISLNAVRMCMKLRFNLDLARGRRDDRAGGVG